MKIFYNKYARSTIKLFFLIFILFTSTSACTQDDRPNILWIVSEDNSKHYLSMYDSTGVDAPNIESLAEHGLVYNHAFSNTPVCSASRSTLISGVYGNKIASHYHRRITKVNMPSGLDMWPKYLKNSGYHTTNDSKTDFNINSSSLWSGNQGWRNDFGWRDRAPGQPFFHFYTTETTHESQLHFRNTGESVPLDTSTVLVEPRYPDTELFRYTGALYRKRIIEMDEDVGRIIDAIKQDGLYDSTFIFYFGDHGGSMPGSKGYNHETGVHVPLVIHIPEQYEHLVDFEPGDRVNGFVSFVDFGASVLNLAGITIPEGIDGKPFIGPNVSVADVEGFDETFSYADRFDEKYDFVRSIRKGKYKYTRNYEPFNQSDLWNNYRYNQLAYRQWRELFLKNELNELQTAFFKTKPVEMLYDVESDPYETTNLYDNPNFNDKLIEMRGVLSNYLKETNDLSFYPEFHLVNNAFPETESFGVNNSAKLQSLMDIADLQLQDYAVAEPSIISALESSDEWERYWGLIVCSSFGQEAVDMVDRIRTIGNSDNEATFNRIRALEFLALTNQITDQDIHAKAITDNMYKAESVAEILLYLNSMAMLKEKMGYKFEIQNNNIDGSISQNGSVSNRLKYLFSIPGDTVSNIVPTGKYDLLYADSEEDVSEHGHARNVFDDYAYSIWHTKYSNQAEKELPNEIIFRLDGLYMVDGFRYLPRQNGSRNGRIGRYELYVSDVLESIRDSQKLVSSGTWSDNDLNKDIFFNEPIKAKFFRLVALTDWSNGNHTSAAELRVFGDFTGEIGDLSTEILSVNSSWEPKEKLKLYPNPTSDIIYVDNLDNNSFKAVLIDLNGRIVLNFVIKDRYHKLDLSSLAKGIYTLIFKDNDKLIKSSRIVKQ